MLDLPTFLLIIGFGNLGFAGLMAAYARGPIAQPALRMWMWARVVLGTCQIASWGNLQLQSPILGQVIAQSWIAGMALEVAAYCLFFRFPLWRRVLVPTTVLCAAAVAIAQLRGASVLELIPVIAIVVALFAGAMGTMLLWPRTGTPGLQRIIGMNDALLALSVLAWVWTGEGSTTIQSIAFMAGYMLMIVKGFGFLLLCKQEDDRKMLHLATIDSLTGLLNRYAFFDQAEALRRAGAPSWSVLMLDLDHFKHINDRYGHATGDAALRQFAATLHTVLAGRGVAGRLGGEEFALLLPMALGTACALGEALRAAVAAAVLPTGGAPHVVTVSIGVALLQPGEALTAGLARADQALYDAKRGGRNRVVQERVEVEPARLRDTGIGMAGQHDAVLGTPHARQQFCA